MSYRTVGSTKILFILCSFLALVACKSTGTVGTSEAKSLENVATLKPDKAVCTDGSVYGIVKVGTNGYEITAPNGSKTTVPQSEILATVCPEGTGGEPLGCATYDLNSAAAPAFFTRVINPGFSDHGSLKWPGGAVFYKRNPGFADDKTLFYPNGKAIQLLNPGFANHKTLNWPNGQEIQKKNLGFENDGTIFRPNGSTWLLRHVGFNDDMTFTAPNVHKFESGNEKMAVQINQGNGTFKGKYEVRMDLGSVIIRLDQSAVTGIDECVPTIDFENL